jgi:predicted ATPase
MPQVLCPVLIGRSDEVEQLGELLAEARAGSGRLAFVLGEAGIGKSRLLRETETSARDLGMRVLTGRAVPGGTHIPFRPLAEAVQSWTRVQGVPDDPALKPHRSALGWLIPEWRPKGRVGASPVMMLEAVVRLLRAMAENVGLLLSLDDLHWADADTLSIVEYLADNLGSASVLCLCAVRSDERGPAGLLAERLAARRAASRIALHRLGDGDVDEMILTALPSLADAEGLGAVRARAEGVPFLVEEMLSAYLSSGTLALPASYRELVRARMAVLGAESRGVVQAAAAIGRDFDWTVVAAITGLGRDAVLMALRAAIASQLIGSSAAADDARFSFRHALIREAILEDLLPPERTELFLRVAGAWRRCSRGFPATCARWRRTSVSEPAIARMPPGCCWRSLAARSRRAPWGPPKRPSSGPSSSARGTGGGPWACSGSLFRFSRSRGRPWDCGRSGRLRSGSSTKGRS